MSSEIMGAAIEDYAPFPLAFRNVEDLLREFGMQIGRETGPFW